MNDYCPIWFEHPNWFRGAPALVSALRLAPSTGGVMHRLILRATSASGAGEPAAGERRWQPGRGGKITSELAG